MPNQTASVSMNMDDAAISGLVNGDTLTINSEAVVTQNSDTRWSLQGAVNGGITVNSGAFKIDGTTVWLLPFDGATGNVPTRGTTISRGGVSGEMLAVFSNRVGVVETAPGAAMPATGVIKLRSVTGGSFTAGALTGIAANATGAGERGWIHYVQRENTTWFLPRLGNLNITGDWFYLDPANGADDQQIQHFARDEIPAVWVETGNGTNVYEIWLNAGSARWGNAVQMVATDIRGKFFGCSSTGLMTFAKRAANPCGFKPVSGARIRVPNIHISGSSAADWNANLPPNATFASRVRPQTQQGGIVNMSLVSGTNFAVDLRTNTYRFDLSYVACYGMIFQTPISNSTIDNLAIGVFGTQQNSFLSGVAVNIGTVDISYTRACNYSSVGGVTSFGLTGNNCTMKKSQFEVFGDAASANNSVNNLAGTFTGNGNTTEDCTFISMGLNFSGIGNKVKDHTYCDLLNGTTKTIGNRQALILGASTDCTIDGIKNYPIANTNPFQFYASVGTSKNTLIKNIGSYAAPVDAGGATTGASGGINLAGNQKTMVARVYFDKTRVNLLNVDTNERGSEARSVYGVNAQALNFQGVNMKLKGVGATGVSGSYGTHWLDQFISTTAGNIYVRYTEPTTESAAQMAVTAGTPKFSGGAIIMASVGDEVVATMDYFSLGHTSFKNVAPTFTAVNIGNFAITYQIDTGTGFSAYKTLNAANLSAETISPSAGFKLRIKVVTVTANAGNNVQHIRIDTNTTSADQEANQYPLPGSILSVAGLVPYSNVRVSRVDTGAVIAAQESGASTSIVFDLNYTGSVKVEARNASGATAYKPWVTQVSVSTTTPVTAVALQEQD